MYVCLPVNLSGHIRNMFFTRVYRVCVLKVMTLTFGIPTNGSVHRLNPRQWVDSCTAYNVLSMATTGGSLPLES